MRMIANNPAAVAAAFSSSWRPVSSESCWATMPEPMTTAARNALPRYSANNRLVRRCAMRCCFRPRPGACRRTRPAGRRQRLARDRVDVVGDALDPRAHLAGVVEVEHGERAARVAVLGLADRAAVDEQHTAELADPRLVRVAEHEHVGVLGGGEPLVEPVGLVLEQVLVDLARRAVHEMDLALTEREAQVERQSRMKSLAAWSVCSSVQATDCSPSSRSCWPMYAQPQSSRSRAIA